MHIYLTGLSGCIECTFYQVFFQRSAYSVFVAVELQQSFRQGTVVQSGRLQQVGHHSLVILFRNQRINVLSGILYTSLIQFVVKSKVMNAAEKFLFKISSRFTVISSQEFKQVLEHTAGSSRCRNEFYNLLVAILVSIPCFQIFFLQISVSYQNTPIFHRCRSRQFQIRKSLFKASQLFCNLCFGNSFFQ